MAMGDFSEQAEAYEARPGYPEEIGTAFDATGLGEVNVPYLCRAWTVKKAG